MVRGYQVVTRPDFVAGRVTVVADEAHLEIIRQGVEAWNRWRQDYPGAKPDLSGADLTDADLGGADLAGADLTEAALRKAYFGEAGKRDEAALKGGYVSGANISQSELRETLPRRQT
jgi:uncharacterized protein YjbI with pentapeptide repeats